MSDKVECEICKNIFQVSKYGGGNCPKCGQSYCYDENYQIELTEEQLELLQRHSNWKKEFNNELT